MIRVVRFEIMDTGDRTVIELDDLQIIEGVELVNLILRVPFQFGQIFACNVQIGLERKALRFHRKFRIELIEEMNRFHTLFSSNMASISKCFLAKILDISVMFVPFKMSLP